MCLSCSWVWQDPDWLAGFFTPAPEDVAALGIKVSPDAAVVPVTLGDRKPPSDEVGALRRLHALSAAGCPVPRLVYMRP